MGQKTKKNNHNFVWLESNVCISIWKVLMFELIEFLEEIIRKSRNGKKNEFQFLG